MPKTVGNGEWGADESKSAQEQEMVEDEKRITATIGSQFLLFPSVESPQSLGGNRGGEDVGATK
jgi:hypothetical protein